MEKAAMDCQQTQERLTDYLLGEVSVRERDALRTHLVGCPACTAAEAAQRRAIMQVGEALHRDQRAPEDFTERVMRRVGSARPAERSPVQQAPARRFHSQFRSRFRRWAIALTITLLGATAFRAELSRPRLFTQSPSAPGAETGLRRITPPGAVTLTMPAMVSVYRDVTRAPTASEVGTTDPAGIAAALTHLAGFRVAPVNLAAQGVSTRSARISRLLGRPVAVLVLAYRGQALALYQMDSRGVSLPVMPVMNAAGRQILCGRTQDCHLVAWRSDGRLFVLAGNVPDRRLIMLASAVPHPGEVS